MITAIREVRRARGLTLEEVARRCSPPTTAQTIGRLEMGTRTVSVAWLNRIAAALEVEASDLVSLPERGDLPVAATLGPDGAHAPRKPARIVPPQPSAGAVAEILVVAVFLAQKSLADHVGAVAQALRTDGIEGGRKAVSMIVGRDPDQLDEGGVSRAAIESLAENASDGVIAPAFWFLVGGLPGLFVYKLVNTADSMIGHRSARYLHFGWFAARFDDVLNLIPARLTGLLTAGACALGRGGKAGRAALAVMWRDARLHRSPNAGWPESAFAGALGLALAGPRQYGEEKVEGPMLNAAGRRDADAADIDAALALFWSAMSLATLLVIAASGLILTFASV